MNKKDMAILAVLIGLVLSWPLLGPVIEKQLFPKSAVEPVMEPSQPGTELAERPSELAYQPWLDELLVEQFSRYTPRPALWTSMCGYMIEL